MVKTVRSVLALGAILASGARAIDISFCSTVNTGSFYAPDEYDLNSLGYCRDNVCSGQYAFAITQGKNCWCSDFAPETTSDDSECNLECPGYPPELCGSSSGDFSYLEIGKPSGTADGPGGTTSPRVETVFQTVVNTVTNNRTVIRTSVITQRPMFSATTTRPQPSIQIITVSGDVQTLYVTASPGPTPAESGQDVSDSSSGLSNGAVAGITIGVVAAVAIAAFIIWLFCFRRRTPRTEDESRLNRNTSVLSKAGLLRHGSNMIKSNKTGAASSQPPKIDTDIPQASAAPSSATSATMLERRDSRPLFRDQRLNPHVLMLHSDVSRTSVGTLQDNQDYSRPLEVRNPDPHGR